MKAMLSLAALIAVIAAAGCCGPHPVRDSWCQRWGYAPSSYQPYYGYQQQPYQQYPAYQQPACCPAGTVPAATPVAGP